MSAISFDGVLIIALVAHGLAFAIPSALYDGADAMAFPRNAVKPRPPG